jgi:NADH-quinone oxidoreductase chain G
VDDVDDVDKFFVDGARYDYGLLFGDSDSSSHISVLDFCESEGYIIPHYCYHKNLSIAGNCRMCLIEISKSPKPVVSCSLNAQSSFGSQNKIYTNSPLVKKSRENVMEFLLLNHPLDCPICDQGGVCDLQDQSLFFGLTRKRFYQQKRFVHNKHLGLIVKTIMSRCIHCTRCIRFATEIAGVEELGIFGRGSSSEIGTYVTHIFNSELSGNLIDICPVGALTSKPYPFLYRDWELKKIKTIDPSDGFGTDISVYLKNNVIVKILPAYSTNWITDKTRFIFDGMLKNFLKKSSFNWHNILKQVLINIYTLDHLANHNLALNDFTFLVDENTDLEALSILLILKKRYAFFKLKRSIKTFFNSNIDFFFKTNSINRMDSLYQANICLFIGTNVRYESPYLNIKLKKRNIEGNFRTFSIGSRLNLTFPSLNIGSTLKTFLDFCEGNTSLGTFFKTTKKILSLINTETCQRLDNSGLLNLLKYLNDKYSDSKWYAFNLLNSSLNSLGLSYFYKFKTLSISDLTHTDGLFLIGNSTKSYYILENYIEHNLLNNVMYAKRFNSSKVVPSFFIEQAATSHPLATSPFYKYYTLISSSFFENSGSYLNTQGLHKRVVKFIESEENAQNKEDWQILRKIFCMFSNISFVRDNKDYISFNFKNMFQFRSYINFMYKASQTLTNLTSFFNSNSQMFFINSSFLLKTKLYITQFKMWVKDFYIGGFDYYSTSSKLMINSSIALRNFLNSFSFI